MTKHAENCECCRDGFATFQKKIEDTIRMFGHAVIATATTIDGHEIDMAYTIGLADAGQAEIICFGLPGEVAISLLNESASRLRSNSLPMNEPVPRISNLPVTFKAVPPAIAAEFIIQANNRVRRDLPAVQLIWPDRSGLFPWEQGFDQRYLSAQPLLFTLEH